MNITISWQPGAFKGMSVNQTDNLILGACQMWQKVCGIQFLRGPFGRPTTITIYPYSKPMPGAMVAYTQTRQILYSTLQQFTPQWARMAVAHEIAHCFGWPHSPNTKPEDLMFWKGSSLFYFAAHEARKSRSQFGNPKYKPTPESLIFLHEEIKKLKTSLSKAPANQKAAIQKQIDDRTKQANRVKAEWKAIGDPVAATTKAKTPTICECFIPEKSEASQIDWVSVFQKLRETELRSL